MSEKETGGAAFKNWIEDVAVVRTLGNGWRVGIDGCDVFEDVSEYKTKGRKTLAIAEGLSTEQEALDIAIDWTKRQLSMLGARKS